MDIYLLRVYQTQVLFCCKALVLAYQDIATGLEEGGNPDRVWYGVTNFIIGAGNLSKTLWGVGSKKERARRYTERQPLRDSLSVTDDSPLRDIKIRNDYEHLDERLEQWWNESEHHNMSDLNIGPKTAIAASPGVFGEKDMLRWLDPTTGDVNFWGNELNLLAVMSEVQRIFPIVQAEAQKPHWNTETSGGGG